MEVVAWEKQDSLTFAKAHHHATYFGSVTIQLNISAPFSSSELVIIGIRNRDMKTVVNAFFLSCFGIDM